MKTSFLLVITLLVSVVLKSQNIPVGSIEMIEQRRRNEQLLGKSDPLISYTLRPLDINLNETAQIKSNAAKSKKITISTLPITLIQQFNTLTPNGWNDGAMIPAKGYQTLISAGFYAKYGILSVQLKPEYVYATNTNFETFPLTESNLARTNHIYYLNYIDAPERFGDKPYSKLFWGQSKISLDYKKMSICVSTENLWWGPGQVNSLIMSNNAPGFLHFSLNTKKPIKTSIGSFEAQLISGKLESSGMDVADEQYIIEGVDYKIPKEKDWRYMNGLTINYQPKWIPGLFIGLNRVFQVYHKELGSGFSDYLPVITPFQKKSLGNEDSKDRDQLASVFLRWVFKESHTEIYFENMWNDHSQDFLYLFDSPSQSSAYLLGFNKIFNLNSNNDKYLKFNFEHSDIGENPALVGKLFGSSYVHGIIHQGYTNRSQLMGAGIGPGGNSQTIDVSVWTKKKVWGIQLERFAHNLDYYYASYNDNYQKWIDMNFNAYAYHNYGNIGISAKLNTSWMRHYQWQQDDNKMNLKLQLSLQYKL